MGLCRVCMDEFCDCECMSLLTAMPSATPLMEVSVRCSMTGHQRMFRPSPSPRSLNNVETRQGGCLASAGSASRCGSSSLRAVRAHRRHVVCRAVRCQAAAEKLTVAITGATNTSHFRCYYTKRAEKARMGALHACQKHKLSPLPTSALYQTPIILMQAAAQTTTRKDLEFLLCKP